MAFPRRRSQKKSKKNVNRSNSKQIALLTDINQKLSTNQYGQVAEVLDVPRMKLRADQVYTFSRTINGTVTGTPSADYPFAMQFSLSTLQNATEFTNLFDQYRLLQITVTFTPSQDSSDVYTAIDYDDAGLPTVSSLLEYQTFQVNRSGTIFSRTFNPRCALEAYQSPVSTGYTLAPYGTWLATYASGIPHFGLKGVLKQSISGTIVNTLITYVVQFKHPK